MAGDFSRTDRVADVIRKELAQIIHQEVNDPRIGIITLSTIKISKDLAHAKIYVNVMIEDAAVETIKALNRASGFLRAVLAKRLKIRIVPHLFFVYDDTTIKGNQLSRLIDKACASTRPDQDVQNSQCAKVEGLSKKCLSQ